MITYDTYEAAAEAREDEDTHMVCGVRLEDGSDKYFVLSREVPDDVAYEVAFEIRAGRKLSQYERWLKSMVSDRHEKVDA